MHTLKQFFLTIFLLIKQAFLFPQTIAIAVRQRKRQSLLNASEAERLDRIRNPSDYEGK